MPGTVLNVPMILNNLEEVCVLASPSDLKPRPAGLIRHIVSIPGDFLNAGSYYINAMIVKDGRWEFSYKTTRSRSRWLRPGSKAIGTDGFRVPSGLRSFGTVK